MAFVEDICETLRNASLKIEIDSLSPVSISGGEDIRDVGGIKVFKRGFSVKECDVGWVVKLPCGQVVEEHILSRRDEIVNLIVDHYDRLRNE